MKNKLFIHRFLLFILNIIPSPAKVFAGEGIFILQRHNCGQHFRNILRNNLFPKGFEQNTIPTLNNGLIESVSLRSRFAFYYDFERPEENGLTHFVHTPNVTIRITSLFEIFKRKYIKRF